MKVILLKNISLFLGFLLSMNLYSQRVYDIVVAKDGSGDYIYINSAISKTSNSKKKIFIKNGVYKEKVLIDVAKKNLCIIGESVDGVIITYDDYANAGMSTAETYTVKVEADGFYAENITFQNTATQAQAVAIYTIADTIAFKNCKFLGFQDTHYADKGRQYFLNCETKGDVDFIFGSAAAYYDKSVIISGNRKGGYVTAPSESVITSAIDGSGTFYHGILFKNCIIKAEEGLANNSCYLGRPWGPKSSSVFIHCEMGSHIKPEGWSTWADNNHTTAFFAEYDSKQPGGGLSDVSNRVDWSKQLSVSDTSRYAIGYYFKGWDPLPKTTALPPPSSPIVTYDSVIWNKVQNARGYIILRNDSVIGFSVSNSFYHDGIVNGNYRVKSVNPYGAMGKPSELATSINSKFIVKNYTIKLANGYLLSPDFQKIEIYNITGKLVKTSVLNNKIAVFDLQNGIYIARLITKNNQPLMHKFYIN